MAQFVRLASKRGLSGMKNSPFLSAGIACRYQVVLADARGKRDVDDAILERSEHVESCFTVVVPVVMLGSA
jgi:hypothetical protein